MQELATGRKGHSELLKAVPKFQAEEDDDEEQVRDRHSPPKGKPARTAPNSGERRMRRSYGRTALTANKRDRMKAGAKGVLGVLA